MKPANVVIQCANTKRPDAGTLLNEDAQPVVFVAHPALAPTANAVLARPDDLASDGHTWRDQLIAYNKTPGSNSLGLLPAYQLYSNPAYAALAQALGRDHVYILSAGWGLLAADFLTPKYDITFSSQADGFKRRRRLDHYADFDMLPMHSDLPLIFLGGKDYLALFLRLSAGYRGERVVVYNSDFAPDTGTARAIRYQTPARTNWHYGAAHALLTGHFKPVQDTDE